MRRSILAVFAVFLLTGTVGNAHHSYADFYDHTVSIEGTLERVTFVNPHTILTVRTKDGVLYTGNWRAAFQLHRMGVKPTDLNAGDTVIISGTPSRDAAARQLARLSEVRRPVDGWSWRLQGGKVSLTAAR